MIGVDLNRNYPTLWNACQGSSGSPHNDTYRGPRPASEPETQAMMRAVDFYRPILNISYHSFGEFIIYPFGCRNVRNPARDLFHGIGTAMSRAIVDDEGRQGTYRVGTPSEILYPADGLEMDWQWKEYGVLSYSLEINSARAGFQPRYDLWRNETVKRLEGSWKTLLRRMGGSGVRAKVIASGNGEAWKNVTFSLYMNANGRRVPFAPDANVKPLKLRSSAGLLYQLLQPGTYELDIQVGGKSVRTEQLEIGTTMRDLGEIIL